MEKKFNVNYNFKVLYAIGMVLVICGHYSIPIFTVGNLYPYDTFHIPLFVFISGYFYKNSNSKDCFAVIRYMKGKFLHLFLPYILWNFVYALIAILLTRNPYYKFGMGSNVPINIYTFFIRPFQIGDGFIINVAAWYLVVLFCIQSLNCLIKYFLNKIKIFSEIFYCLFCFLCAYMSVIMAQSNWESPWKICIVRIMYLLFYYELGLFYKIYLEQRINKINNVVALSFNVVITTILIYLFGNTIPIIYVGVFPSIPIITILRAILGIGFWVRITKIFTPVLKESKLILFVSDHTFSFMMHQGLAGIALNGMILIMNSLFGIFVSFDENLYKNEIWYAYTENGMYELHIFYILFIFVTE